jgi:hypothetical protein
MATRKQINSRFKSSKAYAKQAKSGKGKAGSKGKSSSSGS